MSNRVRSAGEILLVEDDDDIREALTVFLEEEGYGVATAIHGREALEKLHGGMRPRMILLDLHMPVMDGTTFREEQKTLEPSIANIPVVMFTASGSVPGVSVDDVVRKPIDVDDLLQKVARICDRHA
jgi:CheY-like chemotaxis protein